MASVGFCASGFVSCHVCLRGFLASYRDHKQRSPVRVVLAAVIFVGVHSGWQVASENRMSQWTPPVEEHAATSFSVETSRCACLTPQLRIRSAAFTPATREQSLPLIG